MAKRAPIAAAVGVLVLLVVVAAPALSLRPYHPDAVDFELAPGGGLHAAGGSLVSPEIRAPKRFNLLGMRWRGSARPAIEVRVRRDGGSWSRWASLDVDSADSPDPGPEGGPRGFTAPAWAGQADYLQYRLSRPVPGLRIHFVNSTGTATAVDRARTAVRDAAHGG